MAMNTVSENPAPLQETPEPRILVRDLFVVYAMVAVAVSLPFWFILVPASSWGVNHIIELVWEWFGMPIPFMVSGLLGGVLLAFPIRLPIFNPNVRRAVSGLDKAMKWFVAVYGIYLIVLTVLSFATDPCNYYLISVGCGWEASSIHVLFSKLSKTLLGTSIGICFITSSMYLKTSGQRWRVLRWSLLMWLLLGSVWGIAMDKSCSSPCPSVNNRGQ